MDSGTDGVSCRDSWELGLGFAAVALVGAIGAWPLAKKAGGQPLQRVFAAVLAIVGLAMGLHTMTLLVI